MTQSQWLDLIDRLNFAHSSYNIATYELLLSYYNSKSRYYHNQQHITATLQHLTQVQDLANDVLAIEVALWFHDVIYNIFSRKNELQSANLANDFLLKNNADGQFIATVYNLIMATCHNIPANSNDERLIADIDLAILGSNNEIYQEFEDNIRKEYRIIPNGMYRKKRKALLTQFLAKPRIYHHDYFYNNFEQQARENLVKAVNDL